VASIGVVPVIGKRSVVLVLVICHSFCVFLKESQQDSCCPFLGVEIEELRCIFILNLVMLVVVGRIFSTDDSVEYFHPVAG